MDSDRPPNTNDEDDFRTRLIPFEQKDAPASVVDLVFVSGLDSHIQPHTSTWGNPRFFWPTELGRILPNVRILVWEVARERGVSTKDAISHLGDRLLSDLVAQRGLTEASLIFIAHSLGGLIVKSALLKAERSPFHDVARILHLTKGICFFGTPQAWGRETWRHAISAVKKALAARTVDTTPDEQSPVDADESDEIRGESRTFRRIVNRLSLPILTFYETETTATNRGKTLIVGEDTAQLRTVNEQVIPRHANHMNIAKFYNSQDRDFRRVRDFITMIEPSSTSDGKPLISMGKTTVPSIHKSETAVVESDLLHALRFDWLSEGIVPDYDADTCDWLLKDASWKRWLSQTEQPLWIFGAPGMGKTVLSKFILQELRKQNRQNPSSKPKHTIGYFFDDRVEARRNFNGLIRALLYHFLLFDSELFRHIRGKYISTSSSLTNDYLIEILNTILEDPRLGKVDLIIEGLDECSAAVDLEMIDFITNVKYRTNIRVIVTARPQGRIKEAYPPGISIDLDSNSGSPTSSIKVYVKEEVKRVLGDGKFPEDFQREVERVLLDRPSPNFLWVRLAIRYIELQRTTLLSRKAITDLPCGSKVDPLFAKYLRTEFLFDKIPLPSVYIVMEAKAPMTVLGLSFLSAATFEEQSSLMTKPNLNITMIEESTIKDFECEIEGFPFLQVQDNAVSLMHSSLRDILKDTFSPDNGFNTQTGRSTLSTRLLEPISNGLEPFLAALNYFIAELCLTYLLASLQENRDPLDFLRYATLYWFEHVQEAAGHAENWKLELETIDKNKTIHEDVYIDPRGNRSTKITPTQEEIKIPKTLITLVQRLLRSDKTSNDWTKKSEAECSVFTKWIRQYTKYDITKERALPLEDTRDTTAFTLAAFNLYHVLGDDLITGPATQYLVAKDKNKHTPMHFIVLNNSLGSLKWVQKRLRADSAWQHFHSLAFQSSESDPEKLENCPVYLAAEYGNKEMVALFTTSAQPAPIASRQRLGRLLHSVAAKNRHKDIFLLLYHGNFLDLLPEDQQDVAESAATLDCVAEVNEIIARSSGDVSLISLLHCAIRSCADHTIDELLPRLDVNKPSANGRTALHEAAEVGNDKIVMKLLDSGAFVNSLDFGRQTPLHLASKAGFATVSDILLKMGARVNLADSEGSIPVHYAAANSHDKVLALLVANGSNLFAADKNGRGPLHLACQAPHECSGSTVQALLSLNARVGARDRRGRTSLHYAAQSGNKTIVWMLVDAGADLLVQDDFGVAPIHLAAAGSSDIMITELLRLGADATVLDNADRSVYYHCIASEHPTRAVFQALMENGVPVDVSEISFFSKSREWLDEFQGVGGSSGKISLTTQTSAASTSGDLLMGQGQVFTYAVDRAESPEGMFRDLDAINRGGLKGIRGGTLHVR